MKSAYPATNNDQSQQMERKHLDEFVRHRLGWSNNSICVNCVVFQVGVAVGIDEILIGELGVIVDEVTRKRVRFRLSPDGTSDYVRREARRLDNLNFSWMTLPKKFSYQKGGQGNSRKGSQSIRYKTISFEDCFDRETLFLVDKYVRGLKGWGHSKGRDAHFENEQKYFWPVS